MPNLLHTKKSILNSCLLDITTWLLCMWKLHLSCHKNLNNSNRNNMISLMSDQSDEHYIYILNVLIPKNSIFKINTHTIYTHFQFHQYSPVTFSTQIFWSLIVSAFVLCAGTIVVISMIINMVSCKKPVWWKIFSIYYCQKQNPQNYFRVNRKIHSAIYIVKIDLKWIPLCLWYWFHLLIFPLLFSIFHIAVFLHLSFFFKLQQRGFSLK